MFKFFQHPSERASQFSESSDIIMFYTFGAELVHFRGFIYYRYLWRNVSVFRSKNALFPCYITPVFIFDTVRLFCFGTAGKKFFFEPKQSEDWKDENNNQVHYKIFKDSLFQWINILVFFIVVVWWRLCFLVWKRAVLWNFLVDFL